MDRDPGYLLDMLDSTKLAMEYLEETDKAGFLQIH